VCWEEKRGSLPRERSFCRGPGETEKAFSNGAMAQTEPAVPKAEEAFFWSPFLVPLMLLLLKSCLL